MAVPDKVKTKTNKNKSATKKTMSKGATTGSQVALSMLIPVVGLKAVSAVIVAKGATAAVKKFGPNLVKAAKKYFNPAKTQKMKTGKGRGVPGNKKEMEDAFVVYKKGPLSKNKKGDVDMGMKKVTKSEGEKMLAKGAARKVGLGTIAAATSIGVGSSLSTDKKEPMEKPTQSKDMSEGYSKKKDKPKKVLDKEAMSATTKDGPSSSKSRSGEPVPKRNAKPSDIDKSAGKSKKVISKKAKNREDDFSQGVRQSTKDSLIFDTTDEAFQSEADDLNLRKGGMPKRKTFGKGGMYKPSKKTYGMKKGGFTSRGASY